jgi:hypothetical protein
MRIYLDTEFFDDRGSVDIISIGIVREDDHVLYLENAEADLSRADQWMRENVLPNLVGGECRRTRAEIATAVRRFIPDHPEFWAYYADYDWVAFCSLFGRMVDLPEGWPRFCRDLKQLADDRGFIRLPKPDHRHNAMADALWVRDMHRRITGTAPTDATTAQPHVVVDRLDIKANVEASLAYLAPSDAQLQRLGTALSEAANRWMLVEGIKDARPVSNLRASVETITCSHPETPGTTQAELEEKQKKLAEGVRALIKESGLGSDDLYDALESVLDEAFPDDDDDYDPNRMNGH